MYKLAIFDLDGTILYTLEDLCDSVNYALKSCDLPTRDIAFVERVLGNGLKNLIHNSVPEGTSDETEGKALKAFQEHYAVHCMDKTRPYTGIPELFDTLRESGCKVAVLSNKQNEPVQQLMEHYFPGRYDLAYGERPGILRKPAPDAIWSIIEDFKLPLDDVVYIGDSEVDYEAATNATVDCILCEWGYRSHEDLVNCGGECIVTRVEELREKLMK